MKSLLVTLVTILACISIVHAQKFGPSLSKNLANYNSFYTTSTVKWNGGFAGVSESQVLKILDSRLRANGIGLDSKRGPSYLELKVTVNRESDTEMDVYLVSLTVYGIIEEGGERVQLVVYDKDVYGVKNGSYYSRNKYILETVEYTVNKFIKEWRANR